MRFLLFVAFRYLRARSKQGVISVATFVSASGVAAGVAALHIALSLNAGIQQEFLTRILGATAHIQLRSLTSAVIPEYDEMADRLESISDVVKVSPTVSGWALLESALREQPAIIKGVDLADGDEYAQVLENIREGDPSRFNETRYPSILLGKELARSLDLKVGERVMALGTRGDVSPFGRVPRPKYFEVVAIYETGLWDYDYNLALTPIPAAQEFFGYGSSHASQLELRIVDLYEAETVAERLRDALGVAYQVQTWIEINRPLFSALQLEKLALLIAIGLIVLVASLNIISTLTMMVTEKGKDIAIITSMGGTARTVNGVFMLQGLIIGAVGTVLGTVLGVSLALYLDHSMLLPLDPQIYQISHVPFRVGWTDVAMVSLAAVLISFLATLYPARAAARLDPVVALRHE